MWIVFAILSAVFAALTSIFAKIGIDGVNSNLGNRHLPYLPIRAIRQFNIGIGSTYPF